MHLRRYTVISRRHAIIATLGVTGCWTATPHGSTQPVASATIAAASTLPTTIALDPLTIGSAPGSVVAPAAPPPSLVPPLVEPPPAATPAAPQSRGVTLSLLTGISIPINGLQYNVGVGFRGGLDLGRFYVGGMVAIHQGDQKSINYGPVASLGIQGGVQTYNSTPLFFVADGGYHLTIPLGGLDTVLTPYLSAGVLLIPMSSSGAYGDTSIVNPYFVIGGGFSYSVPLGPRYSVGLHYRMYDVGDTQFSFGDLSQGTVEHGFSTSIFYAAFYSEVSCRF